MVHLIIDGTAMRVFQDGVCSQGYTYEIAHNVPAGHYEAQDDGSELYLTALSPRSVSDLARHGRAIGVRARWIGQQISLAGIALDPVTENASLAVPDIALSGRVFVSVM